MRQKRQRRLVVPAYAKVNLGLEVLGLREDGYHELRTLFQTVELHDDIVVELRAAGVTLACAHPAVPCDVHNLAWRAAEQLLRYAGETRGVALTLVKRIPVAGGLGGGSSDAAAVLMALDAMLGLRLGATGLYPLARRLGADVPCFLFGGTALGLARGDEIYPLRRQIEAQVVIVDAGRPVATSAVFRRIDAGLTPRENSSTIYRFVSSDLDGSAGYQILTNDLERAALEEAPELAGVVRRARALMRRAGAFFTSLSGSGSSFFGLFGEAHSARRAVEMLRDAGVVAHRCRTLSLDRYRRTWERALKVAGVRPTWIQ
jgi:4-diphosphocytidyl-2-C-methyl-D-erythritol kinase